MSVRVHVRNESMHKRLYRRAELQASAERICAGEGVVDSVELSILFCDNKFIRNLNREYRGIDKPTDVLSFEQGGPAGVSPRPLGDIVISLETVAAHYGGHRPSMREEIGLLFCHGLLHLLGYDHGTAAEHKRMQQKQSQYLGTTPREAWRFGPRRGRERTRPSGRRSNTLLGR